MPAGRPFVGSAADGVSDLARRDFNAASGGGRIRPWAGRCTLARSGVEYDHGRSQAGLVRRDWHWASRESISYEQSLRTTSSFGVYGSGRGKQWQGHGEPRPRPDLDCHMDHPALWPSNDDRWPRPRYQGARATAKGEGDSGHCAVDCVSRHHGVERGMGRHNGGTRQASANPGTVLTVAAPDPDLFGSRITLSAHVSRQRCRRNVSARHSGWHCLGSVRDCGLDLGHILGIRALLATQKVARHKSRAPATAPHASRHGQS